MGRLAPEDRLLPSGPAVRHPGPHGLALRQPAVARRLRRPGGLLPDVSVVCGLDPIWWTVQLRRLSGPSFEGDRTNLAERRVPAPLLIEHFDVVEQLSLPLLPMTNSVVSPNRQCAGMSSPQGQAATTLILAAFRVRGFFRMMISTSWSSAVSRFIRRSTEKPASL